MTPLLSPFRKHDIFSVEKSFKKYRPFKKSLILKNLSCHPDPPNTFQSSKEISRKLFENFGQLLPATFFNLVLFLGFCTKSSTASTIFPLGKVIFLVYHIFQLLHVRYICCPGGFLARGGWYYIVLKFLLT